MRILFITEHFFPEPNCITSGLATAMARAGHSVHVVTPQPNYPLGRFYDGVKKPWIPQKTIENGVKVWRLPMVPYHGKSKLIRGISYLSFLVVALLWSLLTQLIWFPHRVVVYQTPFTMGLAALPFKLIGSKLVFLCVDLWPESFVAAGVAPNNGLLRLLFTYSRWINRRADTLITSTQSMRKRYLADGNPESKVHFVPVWVDGIPSTLPPVAPKVDFPRKVVYAGNIGPAQNLGVLVNALAELRELSTKISVDLYGYGAEQDDLQALASRLGLTNIAFRGRVSPEAAFQAAAQSTASFVHLVSSPMFRMTLPSKLASCLASGTVLLCGVDGEASDMFAQTPEVMRFPAGDVAAVTAILRDLALMDDAEILRRAQAARALYLDRFECSKLTARYLELCVS
jgi:glycosyltransferase involved in cell wall biosynthesis